VTHSILHPENEHQLSINDFWACILRNLTGDGLQTVIKELLATFIRKRDSDTVPAHLENERQRISNDFWSCIFGNMSGA